MGNEKLKMADRRKQIRKLYEDDVSLVRKVGIENTSVPGQSYTYQDLERILDMVGSESLDRDDLSELTNYAYATDPNYASLVNFFADFFLWRYYYFPVQVRDNANDSVYEEIYNLMTEVIDGLNIDVVFPEILTHLFKEGVVYLYTERDTPSKTISTLILNPKYCFPIMKSQYATGIYQFDVTYFEDLGLRDEALELVLDFFPDELVSGFRAYQASGNDEDRFIVLDGRTSTYLQLNNYNFPDKLSVLRTLFDFQNYRETEVERNSAELDRIVAHKIPSYEGELLFEIPEVQDLHKRMSRIISVNNTNRRTRLITSFGDLEVLPLQQQSSVQNETLEKAHEAIFRSAGVNTNLFTGNTKDALDISLQRDQSYVWRYVTQLLNFYNLTINNLYNFKGFQAEINMLPVSHYNLEKMMEMYRRNAEFGIGRLESIVASGTKQKHITHKSKLEEFLKLDEVLKPLKSSHTRSEEEQKDEKEQDNDEEDKDIKPKEDAPDDTGDEEVN